MFKSIKYLGNKKSRLWLGGFKRFAERGLKNGTWTEHEPISGQIPPPKTLAHYSLKESFNPFGLMGGAYKLQVTTESMLSGSNHFLRSDVIIRFAKKSDRANAVDRITQQFEASKGSDVLYPTVSSVVENGQIKALLSTFRAPIFRNHS